MNIEEIRDYCISLPFAEEGMRFGEDYLLFSIFGKIFACIGLTRPDYFVLKCAPDFAIDLRERYSEIEPAWHWNKKHWSDIYYEHIDSNSVKEWILEAYNLVAGKNKKK